MKCPHCHKEIIKENISDITKNEIYDEIAREVHSISSLSIKINIKRSTLIYYLDKLLIEKKIFKEKLKNLKGQQELLRVTSDHLWEKLK